MKNTIIGRCPVHFIFCVAFVSILLSLTDILQAQRGFPVTLQNCGANVTLKGPARRIFIIGNHSIPLLSSLGALNRVVARTAQPLPGIYSKKDYQQLEQIPQVFSEMDDQDHTIISLEAIINAWPDLVLTPEYAADRSLLGDAGIALYSPPTFCKHKGSSDSEVASFEYVYEQLEVYGTMLGLSQQAASQIRRLKSTVRQLSQDSSLKSGTPDQSRAMALYVSGSNVLWAYGAFSMITPIFQTIGLSNVYAEKRERVFSISHEALLGEDPEVIVLLYLHGRPQDLIARFSAIPSMSALNAAQKGKIVALPFPYSDPPTPLSIEGARVLASKLRQ